MGPTWGPPGSCRPPFLPLRQPRHPRNISHKDTFYSPACLQISQMNRARFPSLFHNSVSAFSSFQYRGHINMEISIAHHMRKSFSRETYKNRPHVVFHISQKWWYQRWHVNIKAGAWCSSPSHLCEWPWPFISKVIVKQNIMNALLLFTFYNADLDRRSVSLRYISSLISFYIGSPLMWGLPEFMHV